MTVDSREFSTGVMIRLVAQLLARSRGFLLLPLVAKTMGPTGYATWVQISITLALLVPVMKLGLDAACVRYLSTKSSTVGKDYFSMLFLICTFLAVTCGLGYFFKEPISHLLFGPHGNAMYVELLLLFLIARTLYTFLRNYYRVLSETKKYSLVELTTVFASLGGAALIASLGGGLSHLLLAFTLVEGLAAIVVLIDIIRLTKPFPKIQMANLSSYLHYSIPLIPNALFAWVVMSSDRYIIVHVHDINTAGTYSAAYSMGYLVHFFLTPITFVLFPIISRLWEDQRTTLVKRYLETALGYYVLLAVPAVLGVYTLAPLILTTLTTQEFVVDHVTVLFILLGFFSHGIYCFFSYILQLKEKTYYLPVSFLIAASLNLMLNLLLIPKYGMSAAALSTFIAYFIHMLIVMFLGTTLLRLSFPHLLLLKTLLASAGMVLVLKVLNPKSFPSLVVASLVGASVYFALMALLRGIGRKQRLRLKDFLKLRFLKE